MAKVHRVGDFDSAGNMSATGSENVFVNGGPTLGGALAEVFDLPDAVGLTNNLLEFSIAVQIELN